MMFDHEQPTNATDATTADTTTSTPAQREQPASPVKKVRFATMDEPIAPLDFGPTPNDVPPTIDLPAPLPIEDLAKRFDEQAVFIDPPVVVVDADPVEERIWGGTGANLPNCIPHDPERSLVEEDRVIVVNTQIFEGFRKRLRLLESSVIGLEDELDEMLRAGSKRRKLN